MLTIDKDHILDACVLIYNNEWHKARGLAISNPNLCVVSVYKDEFCKGKLIAYAMYFYKELSCFNLTRLGSYYAFASCITLT